MDLMKCNVAHQLTADEFMTEVKARIIRSNADNGVTIIALDFDNFNYINDLYGYEKGDDVLESICAHFSSVLVDDQIFCRTYADQFLICVNTNDAEDAALVFNALTDLRQEMDKVLNQHYTFAASGGILIVTDKRIPLSALIDRANFARKISKGTISNTYNVYDDKMRDDSQWKKQVVSMMESAISNHEFKMYLQPKVILKTGQVVGAEALARWQSPKYGMIYPDQFISILEQNGFVQKLDFFMLEEACVYLRENEKCGRPVLPISLNFSKCHLHSKKLVERIFETVNRRGVSTEFIEIEFTENLLTENLEDLIEIISDLKILGFKVSIDDFGSAYSSLNYLKDLPVDIVKIDKVFLHSSSNMERGKVVVAKVVELIKSLRMMPIMEGVETEEQIEFLKKLSCDIVQGYFYAKPMPKDDFNAYLKENSVVENIPKALLDMGYMQDDKSHLYVIPQEFQMDNWELYTLGKNIDMGLMKGYLDGEATVQYVNDRALEYLGYSRQEFREKFDNSIVAFTHPNDANIVMKNAIDLVENGKPLQFRTRAIRKDGKVIYLQGRSSCVIDAKGRPVGIYAFQDVTKEIEDADNFNKFVDDQTRVLDNALATEQKCREELRLSDESYRIIQEQSNDITMAWDFRADSISFSDKYKSIFGRLPHNNSNATNNAALRKYVHTDDLGAFEEWIHNTYAKTGRSIGHFRVADTQGKFIPICCSTAAVCDKDGLPIKAVGVLSINKNYNDNNQISSI